MATHRGVEVQADVGHGHAEVRVRHAHHHHALLDVCNAVGLGGLVGGLIERLGGEAMSTHTPHPTPNLFLPPPIINQ